MDLPRGLLDRFGRWPFVCAWPAVIFALSAVPNEFAASSSRVPVNKVAHFGEYAIVAALTLATLTRGGNARPLRALAPAAGIAILLAALYGASDEFHQKFVRGRDPGVGEWSADVASGIGRGWRSDGVAETMASSISRARAGAVNRSVELLGRSVIARRTREIDLRAREWHVGARAGD